MEGGGKVPNTEGAPQTSKLYALFITIREWMASWKIPGSDRLFGHWIDKLNNMVNNTSSQRRLVLVVVCIALFLDNMLYMVIVPIIPDYLREIHAFPTHTVMVNTTDYYYINVTAASTTTTTTIAPSTVPGLTTVADLLTSTTSAPETENRFIKSFKMNAKTYYSKNEDVNVGVLFACKAIFQLLINPFTGTLMDRIGYDIPMLVGLIIIFFSTVMFAFGTSYGALFVARSMQGVGSAFADTSGLAMIADRFPGEKERSAALGIALAFISFGSLVAPPFGGVLYEFTYKPIPFIILALVALFDGSLMMFVMKPVRKERKELKKEDKLPNATPIYKLIVDPYIAVCAGCLVMANVSLAFIEPTIALWMKDEMQAEEWKIGLIWLPAFFPHLLGVLFTVKVAEKYPNKQWLIAAIGLALEGVSCIILPFCKSFGEVIIPLCILCFGIALVDTAILPLMAHLVDIRHVSVYGSVYAIADISYSTAYAIGPIIAGQIVSSIGFLPLNAGIFVSNIIYAPILFTLRHVYDYQKFEPDQETNLVNGEVDHKLYKTYTASCESEGLMLDEQTIHVSGVVKSHRGGSSDSDEDNNAVYQSSTDVRRMAGYGYNDSTPVPKPRRCSIDTEPKSPYSRTKTVSGKSTNDNSDNDSGSDY